MMEVAGGLLDRDGADGHLARQILQVHLREIERSDSRRNPRQNSLGDGESLKLPKRKTENNTSRRETKQYTARPKGEHQTVRFRYFWPISGFDREDA